MTSRRSWDLTPLTRTGRIRLAQLILAILAIAISVELVGLSFFRYWFFWVAAVSAFSSVLVEPHWTGVMPAAANAGTAIGFFAAAKNADASSGVEGLWWAYLGVALVALSAAAVVLVDPNPPTQSRARWVATRLGRPALLGGTALVIEVLRVSSTSVGDAGTLGLAVGAYLAITRFDWPRLFLPRKGQPQSAVFEAAVYPNLLLFSGPNRISVGQAVTIDRAGNTVAGRVVGRLEHKRSNRYQIVVSGDWRHALNESGEECTISVEEDDGAEEGAVGFIVEGTTELQVRFQPIVDLDLGRPSSSISTRRSFSIR